MGLIAQPFKNIGAAVHGEIACFTKEVLGIMAVSKNLSTDFVFSHFGFHGFVE